ncbi:MAG: glucose 1-dehydrogenase [Saccharospirillaceae bacterium]|nr:glucose 1-dehydrogenase [Saccharospirillaceae bacterium]MCD8533007.1 glucose 1-dehydrogenase [Saccharospirillaceae bacterium]
MKQLSGKTALITGASSGIGRACAKLFAAQGANIVAVARRENELQQLIREITEAGGSATCFCGDVSEENTARTMVDYSLDYFGALDIAVNNAAILGKSQPVEEITMAEWTHIINTNLGSAFLGAKYQIPAMRAGGGGSLVFVSSFVGYTLGMPHMSAYAASKAGVIGLTKALASECAADNIRVNALLPGGTDTPMGQEAASTAEARSFVENLHALKRLASPEEIAHSALYLASSSSSFSTGIALLADGGISVSRI